MSGATFPIQPVARFQGESEPVKRPKVSELPADNDSPQAAKFSRLTHGIGVRLLLLR